MKKVQLTETVLRDANQSLMATRLPYSDWAELLSTHVFVTLEKIHGRDFVISERNFLTTDSRCFSEVRTFWATSTTMTM